MNTNTLLRQIDQARATYKPDKIKCLLIAEAPPDSLDRFFYYDNVKWHDYLFLGIIEVLYPDLKEEYLQSHRSTALKQQILKRLQADGFFLIDLSDLLLSLLTVDLSTKVNSLVDKVKQLTKTDTQIIIIKSNVHDLLSKPLLLAGYKKINQTKIPFPGQGWQKVFRTKFAEALICK